MSAVYAGYGGKVPRLSKDNPDRDYGDTTIHVKGKCGYRCYRLWFTSQSTRSYPC